MTGAEIGGYLLAVGILGFGSGNLFRDKKSLNKDTHKLLCEKNTLQFEAKLETVKTEIITAIKENGNRDCRRTAD